MLLLHWTDERWCHHFAAKLHETSNTWSIDCYAVNYVIKQCVHVSKYLLCVTIWDGALSSPRRRALARRRPVLLRWQGGRRGARAHGTCAPAGGGAFVERDGDRTANTRNTSELKGWLEMCMRKQPVILLLSWSCIKVFIASYAPVSFCLRSVSTPGIIKTGIMLWNDKMMQWGTCLYIRLPCCLIIRTS